MASELMTALTGLTKEQQEAAVRQFLSMAAAMTNHRRLQLLLSLLENLVYSNYLPARLVCECILSCDKLQYQLEDFWVECFVLIRHIIGGVDYKGVREIMKGCKEEAQTIPARFDALVQPQLKALENVIEYIFDRNACLLPSYFIVNDIKSLSRWQKLASLETSKVYSQIFRNTAQMVSIVGHSKMLPVVEHTGYADYLINPWLLNPTTLKFSVKGNFPYDPDLLKP